MLDGDAAGDCKGGAFARSAPLLGFFWYFSCRNKKSTYIYTKRQTVICNMEGVMLTYELKKAPGVPLYEALYRCIRADILSGKLAPDGAYKLILRGSSVNRVDPIDTTLSY